MAGALQQAEADAEKPTKAEAMEESERVLAEQRRNLELIAQCVAAPSSKPHATAMCCAVPWLQAVGGISICLGSRGPWQRQDMRWLWQGSCFLMRVVILSVQAAFSNAPDMSQTLNDTKLISMALVGCAGRGSGCARCRGWTRGM